MNIIGLIKERLTDSVIDDISVFLGERSDNIRIALDQVLPTVLGVIIESTTVDDTGMLMDVLKDGGHTGDILDELPDLFASTDKTQLVITVGTNIFNHFYGSRSNSISETISSLSDIRKTSASSLVGLSAPLVLGAFGKVVDTEGLGISGLRRLLQEEREHVMVGIPPILINKLVAKEETPVKKSVKIRERRLAEIEAARPPRVGVWIILFLLVLALAAGVVYMFKYREKTAPTQQVDLLPLTGAATVAIPDTKAKTSLKDSTIAVVNTAVKTDSIPKPAAIQPNTASVAPPTSPLSEELSRSTNWIALPKLRFDTGSAEVRYAGGVNDIVRFLRNNPTTGITIAGGTQSASDNLGEYRAYGLRELLIERGILQKRITIQPKIESSVDAQVTIKISR